MAREARVTLNGTVYEYDDKEWEAITSGKADAPVAILRWYIKYLRGLESFRAAQIESDIKSRAVLLRRIKELEDERQPSRGKSAQRP